MPFDTHFPNVWSHQILTAVLIRHCYQSSLCVHFIICALALDKFYAVRNAIQPSIMYFAQKANKLAAIAVDCKYITACGLMIASILPSYVCSSDSIPSLFCAYQHLNGIHRTTQNIHIYPSLECFWVMYNIKPLGSKIECGLWLVEGMSHKAWSMRYLLQLGGWNKLTRYTASFAAKVRLFDPYFNDRAFEDDDDDKNDIVYSRLIQICHIESLIRIP